MRNPILRRLLVIFFIIIFVGVIVFLAIKTLINNNKLYYILDDDPKMNDVILTNFNDYSNLVKKLKINLDLNKNDFSDNYYLATFQDFDKCSESKVKGIENIIVDKNNLTVYFKIYNKCGWCRSSKVLYLIKIDKVDPNINVNFDYNYDKTLECGQI